MKKFLGAFVFTIFATQAVAIQCPDGSWHDKLEHCDYPPSYQCPTGEWRNDLQYCPIDDDRPLPKPQQENDQ